MLSYNKDIKQLSRNLRSNMTDAEMLLWSRLRGKQLNGLQFYRQKIIGNYIADFYCPKSRLVIEVDGGQHLDVEAREKDRERDNYMEKAGITVLRFTNNDVLGNIESVLKIIWSKI